MQKTSKTTLLRISFACLALAGCAGKRALKDMDNPDVAQQYKDNKYSRDIVTAERSKNYEASGGEAIDPKILLSIETTISSVYQQDFERCLERQMEELQTRFLRSMFSFEFTITPDGRVSQVRMLRTDLHKFSAKGEDQGNVDPAGIRDCIESSTKKWVFDPAPSSEYTHTYTGQVGEAF